MTTAAIRSALTRAAKGAGFRAAKPWRSSNATTSAGSPPWRRSFAWRATARM